MIKKNQLKWYIVKIAVILQKMSPPLLKDIAFAIGILGLYRRIFIVRMAKGEKKMRMIYADVLKQQIAIWQKIDPYSMMSMAAGAFIREIDKSPTVDAVHGHWIIYPDVCVCSKCNEQSPSIFKYCPNCGALMDEEAKEAWD